MKVLEEKAKKAGLTINEYAEKHRTKKTKLGKQCNFYLNVLSKKKAVKKTAKKTTKNKKN